VQQRQRERAAASTRNEEFERENRRLARENATLKRKIEECPRPPHEGYPDQRWGDPD
jgi:cell division protein FtsB